MKNAVPLVNERKNYNDFSSLGIIRGVDEDTNGNDCCYMCEKDGHMNTIEGVWRPSKGKCLCFNTEGMYCACIF